MSNITLKDLNLAHNNIGLEGGKQIALYLKSNSTLITLNLAGIEIDDDIAKELATAFIINSNFD